MDKAPTTPPAPTTIIVTPSVPHSLPTRRIHPFSWPVQFNFPDGTAITIRHVHRA